MAFWLNQWIQGVRLMAQAFGLAGTASALLPRPSRTLRRVGVEMFTQWDEHMSCRRRRIPPLQRTQGRATQSRVIGEETRTEGRADPSGTAQLHRSFAPKRAQDDKAWGYGDLRMLAG
jgi:hypothetical protein